MMTTTPKRRIEVDLPICRSSAHARREKIWPQGPWVRQHTAHRMGVAVGDRLVKWGGGKSVCGEDPPTRTSRDGAQDATDFASLALFRYNRRN